MKHVLTKRFNSDFLALEFYNLVSDITFSVSDVKVYNDGFVVRVVSDDENKINELNRILQK